MRLRPMATSPFASRPSGAKRPVRCVPRGFAAGIRSRQVSPSVDADWLAFAGEFVEFLDVNAGLTDDWWERLKGKLRRRGGVTPSGTKAAHRA